MNVRFYFLNGEHKDIRIETYYEGYDNQILVIPVNGLPYTLCNVSHMIKIKD